MKLLQVSTGWINLHKRYLDDNHKIKTWYDKHQTDYINIIDLDVENLLTIRVTR